MKNLALPIGQTLRTLRLAQGMTQAQLALAAGISRTTLVQIEKGQDAQVSNVAAAAHTLGAEVGVLLEPPAITLRRQARSDLQAKQAASREKHLRVALKLSLGGPEAIALKQDALRIVRLWTARNLCSQVYIDRWLEILSHPPRKIARKLMTLDDEWGPALRQNTPFAVDVA